VGAWGCSHGGPGGSASGRTGAGRAGGQVLHEAWLLGCGWRELGAPTPPPPSLGIPSASQRFQRALTVLLDERPLLGFGSSAQCCLLDSSAGLRSVRGKARRHEDGAHACTTHQMWHIRSRPPIARARRSRWRVWAECSAPAPAPRSPRHCHAGPSRPNRATNLGRGRRCGAHAAGGVRSGRRRGCLRASWAGWMRGGARWEPAAACLPRPAQPARRLPSTRLTSSPALAIIAKISWA
jgi:hypothetical protein